MKCYRCNLEVADGVYICPNCGNSLGVPKQPHQGQYQQPHNGGYYNGSSGYNNTYNAASNYNDPYGRNNMGGHPYSLGKPDNNLVWAILSTVFCCLPLGIYSIILASKVNGLYYSGKYDEAQKTADEAKKWALIGAAIGFGVSVIFFIINFMQGFAEGFVESFE